MTHRLEAIVFCVGLLQGVGLAIACTPEQRAPARTALELNQCVTAVALRHVEDDLKDPVVVANIAAEIAVECSPRLLETP